MNYGIFANVCHSKQDVYKQVWLPNFSQTLTLNFLANRILANQRHILGAKN